MKDKYFLDTNIWVYAHLKQSINEKHFQALSLLNNLPILVISTQVLNEYYSVMVKKKVEDYIIQENIEVMINVSLTLLIGIDTIRLAHTLKLKYHFSYWDSLILASALNAECNIIYSEDMQNQQIIEDKLKIVNPFV
jgi:predicted nucleic acid-binding protein